MEKEFGSMNQFKPALILGALIGLGMIIAGFILGNSAVKIKQSA